MVGDSGLYPQLLFSGGLGLRVPGECCDPRLCQGGALAACTSTHGGAMFRGCGLVSRFHNPKGPKYLCGTKYGFCSSNLPYGLGKYTPYGY